MIRLRPLLLLLSITALLCSSASFAQRFPPPDFETAYSPPSIQTPLPRDPLFNYIDITILIAALAVASYLAIRKRSRNWMIALSIFSLAYFGFYRQGCVCPIGSIQNVALALADPTYAVSLTILAFFFLPLIFTLFFGRTFCAAVCPLGAIQDLVLIKPIRIPRSLERALGLIPYAYLAFAILLAATNTRFIICEFDPFVGFFRLNASLAMLTFGVLIIIVALFIGRPYCRFLCPYSILLRHISRISRRHMTITPTQCTQCQLCADTCPFNSINTPTPSHFQIPTHARRRLLLLFILTPILTIATGWLASTTSPHLAQLHPTVIAAAELLTHPELAGADANNIITTAHAISNHLHIGAWLAGAFIGLAISARLIRSSIYRQRADYEPDHADCVSCLRCVPNCPKELEHRGIQLTAPPQPAINTASSSIPAISSPAPATGGDSS